MNLMVGKCTKMKNSKKRIDFYCGSSGFQKEKLVTQQK
jgi:hypothetical protein